MSPSYPRCPVVGTKDGRAGGHLGGSRTTGGAVDKRLEIRPRSSNHVTLPLDHRSTSKLQRPAPSSAFRSSMNGNSTGQKVLRSSSSFRPSGFNPSMLDPGALDPGRLDPSSILPIDGTEFFGQTGLRSIHGCSNFFAPFWMEPPEPRLGGWLIHRNELLSPSRVADLCERFFLLPLRSWCTYPRRRCEASRPFRVLTRLHFPPN